MQVKLKNVFVNKTKKDGTPYVNKNGENFAMANIVSENGNKASCYIGKNDIEKLAVISSWRPGDTVEVEITKSGDYTNFNLLKVAKPVVAEDPRQETPSQEQLVEMFGAPPQAEKDPINPSDIPF